MGGAGSKTLSFGGELEWCSKKYTLTDFFLQLTLTCSAEKMSNIVLAVRAGNNKIPSKETCARITHANFLPQIFFVGTVFVAQVPLFEQG